MRIMMIFLIVTYFFIEYSEAQKKWIIKEKNGYRYEYNRAGHYFEYYGPDNKKIANIKFFDNGPDYYSEGIRRIVENKKYGYITKDNIIIVKPTYEFAWQFSYGYGKVCKDVTYEKMGEHTAVNCGKVGLVNKKGKLVLPVVYDAIDILDNGKAEVKIHNQKKIINLK